MPEPAPAKRWRFRLASKAALKRIAILLTALALLIALAAWYCCSMPGSSHTGPLPPLTDAQGALSDQLERDVRALASGNTTRSIFNPRQMAAAAKYIQQELRAAGYSTINEIPVERGARTPNLEVVLPGTSRASEIIVIGAHYDTFQGTPGADDNASGVAACLALARAFATKPQPRTIRFVFFVNEEPPQFMTPDQGSWVYAKRCKAAGDDIRAMVALETLAYYTTAPKSQKYPPPINMIYPDTGDFIAFVGNISSRSLVRRAIGTFRQSASFPSQGAALPQALPGVGWSDHWSFWQEGYDAIMVTDTALFRNPNYHTASDKPDTLDFPRTARVVEGLESVVKELAK